MASGFAGLSGVASVVWPVCLVVFSGVGSDCAAGCGVVDFCFLTLVDVGFGYAWITGFRFCVGLV